jgi:uncharacterized protein
VKIWFDILTPKQIMFFKSAIIMLQKQGHEVLCTSRNYREANELSRLMKLNLLMVGNHGGSDLFDKLFQSSKRIMELAKIISKFSPNLVISFSSPEASRVSFGLGINHIGFNDSPHAEAVARLTIPLLTKLFTPSAIPISAWKRFGISSKQIIRYKGLDPVAWLTRDLYETTFRQQGKKRPWIDKDLEFLEELKIDHLRKSILIRLEESKAAYISNKHLRIRPLDLVDYVANNFADNNNIIILCRYPDQITEMSKRFRNKAIVLRQVVEGVKLLNNIDIFVGAGGTMTAESALLGKPTISIAPIRFYIDDYLRKIGLVTQASSPLQIEKLLKSFLDDEQKCILIQNRAARILDKMEDPIEKLLTYVSTINKK